MKRCEGYKNPAYTYCNGVIWPWQRFRTVIFGQGKMYQRTQFVHWGHRSMEDLLQLVARDTNERKTKRS